MSLVVAGDVSFYKKTVIKEASLLAPSIYPGSTVIAKNIGTGAIYNLIISPWDYLAFESERYLITKMKQGEIAEFETTFKKTFRFECIHVDNRHCRGLENDMLNAIKIMTFRNKIYDLEHYKNAKMMNCYYNILYRFIWYDLKNCIHLLSAAEILKIFTGYVCQAMSLARLPEAYTITENLLMKYVSMPHAIVMATDVFRVITYVTAAVNGVIALSPCIKKDNELSIYRLPHDVHSIDSALSLNWYQFLQILFYDGTQILFDTADLKGQVCKDQIITAFLVSQMQYGSRTYFAIRYKDNSLCLIDLSIPKGYRDISSI